MVGTKAGLTATYTGNLRDNRLAGAFDSRYQGRHESGNWYAVMDDLPGGLPRAMRFCGPARCGTLSWSGDHYIATYDDNSGHSVYTVETFTPEQIKMHRFEPDGKTAVLTGRLSPEDNSIVDGRITWADGGVFPFTMTWGTAYSGTGASRATIPAGQVTGRDMYDNARALRDGVLELKKWSDFFQLFSGSLQ